MINVLGILAPALLHEIEAPRNHNHEKLWNECLAKHQLVYVTFYFAVIVARSRTFRTWEMPLMLLLVISSTTFYFLGLKYVVDQERNIAKYHRHDCPQPRPLGPGCGEKLPWEVKGRIVYVTALLAFLSFAAAVGLALSPIVTRDQQVVSPVKCIESAPRP